jgi:hypothetical protein
MYGIDGSNQPDIYSIDQWYVPLTNGSILWLVRNRSVSLTTSIVQYTEAQKNCTDDTAAFQNPNVGITAIVGTFLVLIE